MFGATTKQLLIKIDDQKQGSILRYFDSNRSDRRNPVYHVNVVVQSESNEYEMIQTAFSMKEGHRWDVKRNGELIGRAETGYLTKKHCIYYQSLSNEELKIEANTFSSSEIEINQNKVGETKPKGQFVNRTYHTYLNEEHIGMDMLLIAGLIHVFWLSHQRG